MDTIFVQIAAYRDPQLLPTLRDCVAKAEHPDRLRFGLCWQCDGTETLAELEHDARLRVVQVHYSKSQGVGWARQQTQSLYGDEKYTLQIDSHHRFIQAWDTKLVAMFEATGNPKPILTSYAPSFDPFGPPGPLSEVPWALKFDCFTPEGALLVRSKTIDDWKDRERPLPARFFSGHFAFTVGVFCREVPYDPHCYFHGEEMSMGVRAFTHGYDLFHPHRVVVWHEYTRKYRPKHWDDHTTEKGAAIPWTERNEASLRRNRILFGMEPGEIHFGPFGFGNIRPLEAYEEYAGVNFRLRLVQPYTFRNELPPNPDIYAADEEWLARGVKDFWTCVRVPQKAIDQASDWDLWCVGVHDKRDCEIDRQDLSADEIAVVLAQKTASFILRYRSDVPAHSWRIKPHSRTRGWLDEVTRPIEGDPIGPIRNAPSQRSAQVG